MRGSESPYLGTGRNNHHQCAKIGFSCMNRSIIQPKCLINQGADNGVGILVLITAGPESTTALLDGYAASPPKRAFARTYHMKILIRGKKKHDTCSREERLSPWLRASSPLRDSLVPQTTATPNALLTFGKVTSLLPYGTTDSRFCGAPFAVAVTFSPLNATIRTSE